MDPSDERGINMRRIAILMIGFVLVFLLGCQTQRYIPSVSPVQLTPYQKMLLAQIQRDGVQVVKQGDHLQMILPVDVFFQPQSTEIRYSKQKALGVIAAFVKSYVQRVHGFPMVQVTGHSDIVFDPKTRMRLSREYAQVVAAYLWNHGIPQSRLRVRGASSQQPIASDTTAAGNAMNRRVVIEVL